MFKRRKPAKTPVNLQMEAVECGAAALGSILAFHGRSEPLSQLREACGVNRDGSRAGNILRAAQGLGLNAQGFKRTAEAVFTDSCLPVIAFWKGMHFVVVEGTKGGRVYINDPGMGRYRVTEKEFITHYTGVVLEFSPGPDFQKMGRSNDFFKAIGRRMTGVWGPGLLILALSMILVLPSLAVPVFSKIFVDRILIGGLSDWAKPLIMGMGVTLFFMVLFSWLQQFMILRLQTKLTITTNAGFMWHLLRLPSSFFSQRYAPEITSRCRLNEMLATILSGQFTTAVLNLGMAVFYLGVMSYYDGLLTLFGLVVVLVNVGVVRILAPRRHDEFMRMIQETGKAQALMLGALQSIDTIKSQGMEQDTFSFWAASHAGAVNGTQRLGILTTLGSMAPVVMAGVYNTLILGAGALRITQGEMTIGELVAFQVLANMMVVPVGQLSILGGTVQDASACMKRLDDVLDHDVETSVEDLAVSRDSLLVRNENLTGHLVLDNVTFGYSSLDPPLLENFSLNIEPGARVALVGNSGSGKSTIAKIAAGLYPPWSGQILLDNIPRQDIPEFVLKNCVAMVDQNIFMFEGSFRENLTLWDEFIRDEDIIQSCKDADIYETIIRRPGGLDGHLNENGTNLSGGQRQCLEIARTLVRNPALLILDEASNALDPVREHKIDLNIRQRGCSCLIVAHRLSTIRDADEIIVLDQGRVVQRGTHDQLLEEGGLYKTLITTQTQ